MAERIARFDREIPTGLHPSLPNAKIPLWVDGRNVIFFENAVQPSPGQFQLAAKAEVGRVIGAIESLIDGKDNVFFGTPTKLYRFQEDFDPLQAEDVSRTVGGGAYTGINDATASEISTRWSFAVWGRWILAVNGKDAGQIWKPEYTGPDFSNWNSDSAIPPTSTVEDFPWTKAQIVRTIGPYAIVLNVEARVGGADESDFIYWCDTDDVHNFTAGATTAAGQLPVRDLDSPILAAEALGGGLGFYGSDHLHILEFIGAPFYFGQRHLLRGLGAVSKDAVAVVGKVHYGLGPLGIFRTDGFQVQYIDDPSIHDFIFTNLTRAQISKCIAWYAANIGVVFFSFPLEPNLDNSIAVGYAVNNGTWSIHDFARSAASTRAVFDFPITFSNTGTIFQQGAVGVPPSGDPLPLTLIAAVEMKANYGHLGYGDIGYGGTLDAPG